jgi:hypothetical protein
MRGGRRTTMTAPSVAIQAAPAAPAARSKVTEKPELDELATATGVTAA